MLNLILAILSSTAVTLVMRTSEKYSKNSSGMLAANYVMCLLLSFLFTGSPNPFPREEGLGLTIGLGVFNGFLFLAGFLLLKWNVSKNGVALPATFMRLGVIVPTLVSILVFGESPRVTQILGILVAIGAIVFLNEGGGKASSLLGLIVLLLAGGGGDAMSKVFEETAPAVLKNHFLLYTFATALILCLALCLVRRQPLKPMDILFGFAIGIPNYFSTRFLLLSLNDLPAVVAYPVYSVGTILLIALGGMVFFREKLGRRRSIGMGIIFAALILLNL